DFPEEQGQIDGSTQHVIERLLGLIVRKQGMVLGILPAGSTNLWRSEGERNWTSYFRDNVPRRINFAAVETDLVSFDVFDTLVTRPFLTPEGARACLEHHVRKKFGVNHFMALRERAEVLARGQAGGDVDNAAIYSVMRQLPEARDLPVDAIRNMELMLETRWLQPRTAVLEAAR